MKRIAFWLLVIVAYCAEARSQDNEQNVLYKQNVIRDDKIFKSVLKDKRGEVLLTNDSFSFKTKNLENSEFNFSLPYNHISEIRRAYGFVLQNRIKIRTIDGNSYRLFTYKKKNIIRITRARMQMARKS